MRRRSKDSAGPPLILSLLLILPWYCGPIAATMAYAVVRWVIPWWLPLPTSELKTPGDGISLLFASFAQAGPSVAPILAVMIMFAWLVAELMKLARRVREGDVAWPYFRKNRAAIDSTTNDESATLSMDRPRTAPSEFGGSRRASAANRKQQPRTAVEQSREAATGVTNISSQPVHREIDLSQMSWKEFEILLVQVLRRFGFQAEHTGRNGPDGGIDVRCTDSKGETILVQCKHWQNQEVGVTVIREFFGVLIHEQAARGLVVSSGLFTQEARKFAENKPLTLVDGEKLLKVLAELPEGRDGKTIRYRSSHLQTVISSQPCPRCDGRMIRKKGRRGVFLSCERYPDCEGSMALTLE